MSVDRMDRVPRDRIDMPTAFASDLKRARLERSSGIRPTRASAESPVGLATRGLSNVVKPVLRPFVLRLRTLLVGGLEEELRQLRRRMEERLEEIWQFSYAAQRRVAVPLGDRVLVRTEVGYVLCSTGDVGTLAVLIEGGELERGTRLLIQRLIEPGQVFVDVGANLGLHTLAAARVMDGKGRVYAFEPFEPTVRLLRESVVINGLSDIVEIHQAAVSDHHGSQPLFLGVVSGHHSLLPLSLPYGLEPSNVDVPLVTLDEALANAPAVDLIKVDVEGAELEVLSGARSVIESNPGIALIVEYGPSHLKRAGHSAAEWFSRFDSLGLTFREIDADTGRLYERSIDSLQDVESANLVFAHPDAIVWNKAMR